MKHFAEELHQARVAGGVTLADIAASKLISVAYLEEMERGNFTFVPQTYIRAFVREYASSIGLDPDETLRRYDEAWNREQRRAEAPPAQPAAPPKQKKPAIPRLPLRDLSSAVTPWLNPIRIRIGLGVLLVGVVATIIWNIIRSDAPAEVGEIPFGEVIKDNEQRLLPGGNTIRTLSDVTVPGDSLSLTAYTRDTVWMQITIDNLAPEDYIFYPNGRMSWKATRRFLVTLGNAGGVELVLNRKNLGTFGNKGTVVRNLELTRQTLAKQQ
jgi:Helix-turn-helix domain/RodZ C-terminal domain